VNDFLRGALAMACFAIGLFFLRYWRETRDRLFPMFSAGFWLLGLNWTLATLAPRLGEYANALRFLAFVLIALAVVDKNGRKEGRGRR
jgi:hypothetical protein